MDISFWVKVLIWALTIISLLWTLKRGLSDA